MSEYQYFEFQTVDRPLTTQEQEKISALSSRVQLTATSAVFTYSFGDFRGDPAAVLAQYFDAMFYLANWGTTRLMFRLPRKLITVQELVPFCDGEIVSIEEKGEHLLLDIRVDDEPTGWVEGNGILRRLLPLRQQILERDLRVLYLAWLNSLQGDSADSATLEPPVPANLAKLSPELKAFAELFEVDPDLVAIAAEASPTIKEETGFDETASIPKLSMAERDQYLARLARGEAHLAAELRLRLRSLSGAQSIPPVERRSIGFLLSRAERRKAKREKEKRAAAEKARLDHLDSVARQESQLWDETRALIEQKLPKSYDAAVLILRDLHALASHRRSNDQFQTRLQALRDQFRNRPGLISRLHGARL